MSAFMKKYKREILLILISVLAIYGLPLLYRILPAEICLPGEYFLRLAAAIVFGTVVWYSFSANRRFIPILSVGVLSIGMRASLYGNRTAALMSRSAAESAADSTAGVWLTLLFLAAGVCIGLIAGALYRRLHGKNKAE